MRGDEGTRGERRTFPPIGKRKREETDIRRSVLKTGGHPFAYTLSVSLCLILSYPLALLPPPASLPTPPFSCIPPPWENRDNKLAFFSRLGPGRRTLGQPSECPPGVPMDPSCPFPFQSARKQSLCQHLSLRKLVKVMALLAISMATRRKEWGLLAGIGVETGVARRKSGSRKEGVKGSDNGVAVASLWLCQGSM